MNPLTVLQGLGLTAEVVEGDRLYVSPRDRITDEIRQYIRKHRPEVIQALQVRWNSELAAEGYQWCLDCRHWSGASIDDPAAGAVCTHSDNPFRKQQPAAPRICRWYEVKIGRLRALDMLAQQKRITSEIVDTGGRPSKCNEDNDY